MKRKICVVTSTRAEYGIMSNLIKKMSCDKDFDFKLCVTGTHLSEKYGYTRKFIELDSKFIDEVNILDKSDEITDVYSEIIYKFDNYFKANNFDLIVLLGDRYEIFAIASVAYINHVKIAHIHGGEVTYGALDEQFRHCITKLSNIHFPSCEKYRNRIIQMGEDPKTVFNVGSLSVENISKLKFLTLDELNKKYQFELKNYAMITFNPVTNELDNGITELTALLESISKFSYELLILYPNMDNGNEDIISIIEKHSSNKCHVVKSLNYLDYLSFAKHCSLFIGNSSSGIIEIPSFNVPIINVGNRQNGREASRSVISCSADEKDIVKAIHFIESDEYKKNYQNSENIFYKENSADYIIKEIKEYLNKGSFDKYFYSIL